MKTRHLEAVARCYLGSEKEAAEQRVTFISPRASAAVLPSTTFSAWTVEHRDDRDGS